MTAFRRFFETMLNANYQYRYANFFRVHWLSESMTSVSLSFIVKIFYFVLHDNLQALETSRPVIWNDRTLITTKEKTIEVADRSHSKNRLNALVNERVISITRQSFTNAWNLNSALNLIDLRNISRSNYLTNHWKGLFVKSSLSIFPNFLTLYPAWVQ